MTDRIGEQLGNYRLTKLLGQGGFAEVYLGEHIHLGTQAAIKVLHTQLATDDLEGFRIEARTVARLEHPNIVRVLEFGIEASTPFLVMNYAPNGSLRQRHPKGVPLPLPTIVSYVRQVADALQFAHDEKVIHRDVKPENMLMGRRNEVLLSDFGIALIAQSTSSQSRQEVIGTVIYMAPEQIQGKPRPASDQYALGVIVYEWLSGDRPFHGSFTEIATQHLLIPPPPLRGKLPTIAPAIEQVVMTVLAKDPQQRFRSVQAFATALEQASLTTQQAPTIFSGQSPQPNVIEIPPTQYAWPLSTLSSSQSLQHKRSISRRTMIIGLAGLAVTGGGISWLVLSQRAQVSSSTPHPTPAATSTSKPTPTSTTLGTMLYTYRGHTSDVDAVTWSPDGRRIASASLDVQVWDANNGGNVYTYRGHSSSFVYAVAWSPDSRRIASGNADTTVQVWDASNGGNVYTYRGHSSPVWAVAWSPDSRRIASGSGDNTVQVWDASNGGNVYTYRGHSNALRGVRVAWSPDGRRIASGSGDNMVQVWDANNGGNVYTYRGHASWVNAVAWSADGRRIASGSGDNTVSSDNTVQVWDASNGGNVYTYRGHISWVNAVAWSPDGRRIASASSDVTVQVWQPS